MAARQNNIQAVLFDLDDTLIDWSGQEGSYFAAMSPHLDNMINYLEADGHNLADRNGFKKQFGEIVVGAWAEAKASLTAVDLRQVLRDTCLVCDLDVTRIDLTELLRAYDAAPVAGVALYPDTLVVLDTLRDQGYRLGLITNSMMPMWMRDAELRAFGLLDYFDVRLSSGDAGYIKPHPQIYFAALAQLDLQPPQAIFVGDRPGNDIAGANAAGLTSVLLTPPHLNYELNGVTPDHIITSLSDLLPVLALLEEDAEKNDVKTRPE